MNDNLLQRVKNSLNKQYYVMNDSWLADCVDFYMNDHPNPTQEEITAFVMNQWTLYDLREINNENGCLPRNLANQKCTSLPGKYILQVDKMYDISTSKYKQLEKIKNVSSENIEATENENKTEDDKCQTWEPKSKRMLQLHLTDGVQDILAIEYRTIRFLKELLPGYKLMIKGPVICRKGVILLEENNIVEIGGEVDSLLVMNAVENILARALNLDENPDPYNDKSRPKQNTESTQNIAQVDDDFDLDSEVIDQIDKQIQQQNTNISKNLANSNWSNKQSHSSKLSELNYSYQAPSISNVTQKSGKSNARNQMLNSGSTLNSQKNKVQQKDNNEKIVVNFDDEGDSFLEKIDDSEFKTPSVSKASSVQSKLVTTKQTSPSKSKDDEFPVDDEIYDLTDSHSPFFPSSKPKTQSTAKINSQKEDFSGTIASGYRNTYTQIASQRKANAVATPSVSDVDNLDFTDIDMDLDGFDDYFDTNTKNNLKSSKSNQVSATSSPKVRGKTILSECSPLKFNTNSTVSSDATFYENEFEEDLLEKYKRKMSTLQKSSQASTKSLSTSKNEEPITKCTSSQLNKNSSAKLSDKLKLENKNKDYYNTNNTVKEKNCISSQISTGSLLKSTNTVTTTTHSVFQTNKCVSTETKLESQHSYENLDADFQDDFEIEFEAKMEVDNKPVIPEISKSALKLDREKISGYSTTKSQDPVDNNVDTKPAGSKRPAGLMSPPTSTSSRQKLRCVESASKDKTSSRKITDFFDKPIPKLLNNCLPLYEPICDVLEKSREDDRIRSVVRGKVINVVKLNLLKGERGSYFHLEGTITDGTANLDVVFCSEVLEEIVGYSTQEFILKRKRAKADPVIKDQLRDDLTKAQRILRLMDALMEIEVKKNEKTIIIAIRPLSKEDKKRADERLERYKAEKNL